MTRRLQKSALPLVALLLLVVSVLALAYGGTGFGLGRVLKGLLSGDSLTSTVVINIRLPRLLVGILVGAALGGSGLLMQAYFRNSLASPGLLGVSAGGAAGAVTVIALGLAAKSLLILPTAAIIGSCIATVAVLMLARRGASAERLLLAGIALNALLGAVVSYILSSTELTYERNAQILFWLLGGLEDRTWEHVWMALPILAAALLSWPLGRPLDLLSLGEPEAASLGVDVPRLRRQVLALTTLLTALATAVAGSIGFVGLLVPHLLRLLVGPEHKRLLPLCLVGGAAFTVGCDLLGRMGGGIRVGIVTSLLGGPFFLWLLRRQT
ncbi:FecCD family ABC transporter permease [Nibricoccus sp. IMCC34717]|uniref:FecCD family ABC transporter permease n=1 Tax=Nibricoccus sp. IMCC34717 TaxID=3034021 RepID=UPI00384A8158